MVAEVDGTARGGESLTIEAATGRITARSETWAFPGVASAPASTETYTYDPTGRLASVTSGGTTKTYTYDASGNRAGATVDAQDRVTRQGDVAYAYDAAGFVTRREAGIEPAQLFTWDAAGSLLNVSQAPRAAVAYDIDAAERRVGKRRDGVRTRVWAYAGALTVEAEVVSPDDADPETRLYGYLPDVRLPVLMTSRKGATERTYRLYADHLGSLRAVVDTATGQAVQTMSHDPWGNVTHDVVAPGFERVPFGFAGGLYDEDTGLVRFGAREYDPRTGRWLSKDPIRFSGGMNLYGYIDNDPVNRADPSGLKACTYQCTGGFHHTWVKFDDAPNRSYGYWPSVSSPLAPVGVARGVLNTNDSPSQSCMPGPPTCRDSTPQENAMIEEELKQSVSPFYVLGVSDCRQVPAFVNQRLDELHGSRSAWDKFWDLFFNFL